MTPLAPVDIEGGNTIGRFELLRALGACTVLASPGADPITDALGLPPWDRADHTRLFVLELPPYASIHLGPEGKLGGEGADRVAGVWRAIGLTPPADADHLSSLLGLYAHLGEAADNCRTPKARQRMQHTRTVVLHEHLTPWTTGYLRAFRTVAPNSAGVRWAELLASCLDRELRSSTRPTMLPLALREAPPPLAHDSSADELLDAMVAPLRAGFVLTWSDLQLAADALGVGLRRGERRFALRAMFEQDLRASLTWLAGHATWWARQYSRATDPADTSSWWRSRATATADVLTGLVDQMGSSAVPGDPRTPDPQPAGRQR